MLDLPREGNLDCISVTRSSPEVSSYRDMLSSKITLASRDSSTDRRNYIHNGNRVEDVQVSNDRWTMASSRIRSRRYAGGIMEWTLLYKTFIFAIWCFVCDHTSAVQCNPCPSICTCPPISGTLERCVVNCSNTDLTQLPVDLPSLNTIISLWVWRQFLCIVLNWFIH